MALLVLLLATFGIATALLGAWLWYLAGRDPGRSSAGAEERDQTP